MKNRLKWGLLDFSRRQPRVDGNLRAVPSHPATASVAHDLRDDAPSSPEKNYVLAERANIHADLVRDARRGFVPADALIGRLYTNHVGELAKDRRQLDALEQALDAHLRRIGTLFPTPLPPMPEPPLAPRPRHYGPIGETRRGQSAATRH